MKKKILLSFTILLFISYLIAEVIHVNIGDSIQDAVNYAASYDTIIIHPYDEYPFYYEENVNLDYFTGDYLTITGEDPTNWSIVEQTHVRYADPYLPVFYTEGNDIQYDITINILGIKMYTGAYGIELAYIINHDYDFNLNIENCIFRSLGVAIETGTHAPLFVENCIFRMCGQGVLSTHGWDEISQTDYLLNISGCEFTNLSSYSVRSWCPANIDQCTFVQHNSIYHPTALYTRGLLNNSIIWGEDFGTTILGNDHTDSLTVQYSDIEGGVPQHEFIIDGYGNINADPLFSDSDNNDFQLTLLSPCIDTGNPSSPLDPDDTRADMGCYYFHHDYDIHHFSSDWHWESFPRIGIEFNNNDLTDIVPILGDIDPFNDITEIHFDADGENDLTYDPLNLWTPDNYDVQSSWLYKIEILPEQERILTVEGGRLPVTFDLSEEDPLESGTYHWLGYWLPRSQNIVDAFGEEFWQYVEKVKSEDWYYNKCSIIRVGDPSAKVSWSTENKTLVYGKGYMVWFKDTPPITDFHWTDSGASEGQGERGKSEYFTYEEKSDYEVVDVMNIPENIIEIGVFQDTTCVGAVVVQDSCAQILVYSDNVLRDPLPFNFEVVTGRGSNSPILNYEVLNFNTGRFEKGLLISGRQEYSIVKLGEQGEPEEEIPAIIKPMLHLNHPNPFNPTTTISFSLPKEEDIELTIYNIKGQKVKTLYSGISEEGKHSVIWNGIDSNGKTVSSGIYFYKLKTESKELTRKMLLLK